MPSNPRTDAEAGRDAPKAMPHHEYQAVEQSARLSYKIATAAVEWVRDEATSWVLDEDGFTIAHGTFDPVTMVGRTQAILRPHLAALLSETAALRAALAEAEGRLEMAKSIQRIAWDQALEEAAGVTDSLHDVQFSARYPDGREKMRFTSFDVGREICALTKELSARIRALRYAPPAEEARDGER